MFVGIYHRLLAMFDRLMKTWVLTSDSVNTESLDDGACMVCSTDEEKDHASMLLCDGCDAAYHMGCLSPRLATVPLSDWFCPMCSESQSASVEEPGRAAVRTLRSTVSGRSDVEKAALHRWLQQHVGEPIMLENGSVGVLQGFRFGYCQIDIGGVEPATKSPHEISLNQRGLEIDYGGRADQSAAAAGGQSSWKRKAASNLLPKPGSSNRARSSTPMPSSLQTVSSTAGSTRNRRTGAAAAASVDVSFVSSAMAGSEIVDRTVFQVERTVKSIKPKNSWACVNCLNGQ